MTDAVIEEIDGRRIRIGDQWLSDFASCNYLGFDLDPEILAAVPEYLARCEDTLILPTITHIHSSVIPVLAGSGTIFIDARAHKTIYDGCQAAAARGATIRRFQFADPDDLDRLLRLDRSSNRIICMDGVNSMTGNPPDLRAFASVARDHGALLYIDDAHGFGVIGERDPDELSPYGCRGNSIVRYAGESYDGIVLVGGFSKAYSSLTAFVACPTELKERLKTAAPPYLYSGPSPVASLATTLVGFDVNAKRGDEIRRALWEKTCQVLASLDRYGIYTPNRSALPIIEIPLANHEDIDCLGRFLFRRGIYVTLAAYPLVPRDEVGFRIQLTAANTQSEIEQLTDVLGEAVKRFRLRTTATQERGAA